MQQSLQILQAPAMGANSRPARNWWQILFSKKRPSKKKHRNREVGRRKSKIRPKTTGGSRQGNRRLAQLDQEWRDYFALTGSPVRRSPEEDEQRRLFLESISKSETLTEHLSAQLHLLDLDDVQRALCETIIGNLDERGFLIASPEELHAWNNGTPGAADAALKIVQSFDPIGVGARDLPECLQLQLERLGHAKDSLPGQIVLHHLDDLSRKRHAEIAQARGVSLEEAHRAATLIGTLDPNPGRRFIADESQYITPDLVVQKWMTNGHLINDDCALPWISNVYKDVLGQIGQGRMFKSYVRERIRAGKFSFAAFINGEYTIMKIAEIVRVQIEFLSRAPVFSSRSDIRGGQGGGCARNHRQRAYQQIHANPSRSFETQILLHAGIRTAPVKSSPRTPSNKPSLNW